MPREAMKAERLEAALSGVATPDELPRDLARLVTLADQVSEAVEIPPMSDAFRERLRDQLLTAPGPRPQAEPASVPVERPTLLQRIRQSARVATATAVASVLIGTTGVAAAADAALPGDLLYGLKGVTEDARLLFAQGPVDRGHLHLAFARERLEEVEVGLGRIGPDGLRQTLAAFDEQAATGANLLLEAQPTPETREELLAFTGEVRARLLEVEARLPLSVRPSAERTFEVLRRIDVQVSALEDVTTCQECGAAAAGSGEVLRMPRVVLPGDGPATMPCACVGGDSSPDDTTPSDVPSGGQDGPALDDGVSDVDDPDDAGSGGLTDVTDGAGSLLDDLLRGGSDQTVDDPVDDVQSAVDDVASDVDDVVDDLGSTVDDITSELDDLGDTLD